MDSPVGGAMTITNCHDIEINACKFGVNDAGIILKDSSTNVTIQNSIFSDSMFHWSAWKMKMTYDLVWPYSCVFPSLSRMLERGGVIYAHGFKGRGIVLRNNVFRDFAQAGHGCPPSINNDYHKSYDIDISENHFSRCFEDGLEVDADARSVRIWGNTFEQINAPISLAVAQNGPVYILRNIFTNLKSDTFTIQPDQGLLVTPGHTFKTNYGSPEHSGVIHFYHNTIDAGEGHLPVDFFSPGNWHKYILKNNIFSTSGQHLFKYHTSAYLDLDMDYNLWHTWDNKPIFSIDTNYQDALPKLVDSTLDANQSMGWSINDTTGDPAFHNRALGEYHINGFGPAIDRGVNIAGINDIYYPFPDIGALEYVWGSSKVQPTIFNTFYPNPSTEKICWRSHGNPLINLITVFDLRGKPIFQSKTSENCTKLPIPKGVYIIELVQNQRVFRGKIILE